MFAKHEPFTLRLKTKCSTACLSPFISLYKPIAAAEDSLSFEMCELGNFPGGAILQFNKMQRKVMFLCSSSHVASASQRSF